MTGDTYEAALEYFLDYFKWLLQYESVTAKEVARVRFVVACRCVDVRLLLCHVAGGFCLLSPRDASHRPVGGAAPVL